MSLHESINRNFWMAKQKAINNGYLSLGISVILQSLYFPSNSEKTPKYKQYIKKSHFIQSDFFSVIVDCLFEGSTAVDVELLRKKCHDVLDRNYMNAVSNSNFRRKVSVSKIDKNRIVQVLEIE